MINEIVCIGTSFTEGDGLNPTRTKEQLSAAEWYKEHRGIEIKSMNQYAWPAQLQTISGIKTRNLGKCGSSIEYLMRTVEEIIEKEDVSDKFFILEYSTWGRSELWSSKTNSWVVANWGPRDGTNPKTEGYSVLITTDYNYGYQLELSDFKIYEEFLDNFFNENEYLIQRDRHFLNLLYKLNAKNIKYQILILEPLFWEELKNNKVVNNEKITPMCLYELIGKNELAIGDITNGEVDNGHPSIEGHEYIANLIYTKLKQHGDL